MIARVVMNAKQISVENVLKIGMEAMTMMNQNCFAAVIAAELFALIVTSQDGRKHAVFATLDIAWYARRWICTRDGVRAGDVIVIFV